MALRERIELLIDVTTTGASRSLKGLKGDVDKVDGSFNKIKTGAAGVFGGLGGVIAGGVAAAGAAITGFAQNAIGDFQDLALESGRLSDSLGLPAEDASRLLEVAGDLGVSVEELESAMGRMNRTAGTSPEKFDNIGAAIARNKDGTINVTETFKNAAEAISRIPDAAGRAKAAQDIFGRGWQKVAELISGGALGITEAMASVEEAKVIDEDEVEKARKFRDMMDSLKGKFESFSLVVGETLVDAADGFQIVIDKADTLARWLTFRDARQTIYDNVVDPIKLAGEEMDATFNQDASLWIDALKKAVPGIALGPVIEAFGELNDRQQGLATGFAELGDFTDDGVTALEDWATATSNALLQAEAYDTAVSSMEWGKSGIEAADTAMGEFTDNQFGLKDIVIASETAFKNLATTVKESGLNFDVTTEAGQQQHEALKAVAETIDTQLIAAYSDAKGDGDKFKESAEGIAKTLKDRLQKELGLSEEDAGKLIDELGLLPDDVETRFKLTGDEEAKIKIGLLGDSIALLPKETRLKVENQIINGDYQGAVRTIQTYNNNNPTSVRANSVGGDVAAGRNAVQDYNNRHPTTVRVNAQGGTNTSVPGGQFGRYASGGDVRRDEMAIVGEEGPELVALPGGSHVYPAGETSRMMSGATAGGGAMGGARVVNVTINMPAGSNGKDVVNAIRDYERYNGTGWRR